MILLQFEMRIGISPVEYNSYVTELSNNIFDYMNMLVLISPVAFLEFIRFITFSSSGSLDFFFIKIKFMKMKVKIFLGNITLHHESVC